MPLSETVGNSFPLREVSSAGVLGGRVYEVPPPAEPFAADPSDANSWSLQTALRYLKGVIELPQYEANFLRYEVNGYALLCLSQNIVPQLGISNKFHSAKIALHAQTLREKVISKAALALPPSMEDWDVIHVAGWLSKILHLPHKVLKVFQKRIDGPALLDMTEEEQKSFFDSFEDTEASAKIATTLQTGLINGVKYNTSRSLSSSQALSSIEEHEQGDLASQGAEEDGCVNEQEELIVISTDVQTSPDEIEAEDTLLDESSEVPAYTEDAPPLWSAQAGQEGEEKEDELPEVKEPPKLANNNNAEENFPIEDTSLSKSSDVNKKKEQTVSFDVAPRQKTTAKEEKNLIQRSKLANTAPTPPKTRKPSPSPTPTEGDSERMGPSLAREKSVHQPIVVMQQLPADETSMAKLLSEIVRYNNTTVDNMNQIIRNLVSEKEKFESELGRARRQAELTAEIVREEVKRQSVISTFQPNDAKQRSVSTSRIAGSSDQNIEASHDLSNLNRNYARPIEDRDPKSLNSVTHSSYESNVATDDVLGQTEVYREESKISKKVDFPDYQGFMQSAGVGGVANSSVGVDDLIESQSQDERHLWMKVVSKFTSEERYPVIYNDSDFILQDVALVWIRLGYSMLRFSTEANNHGNRDSDELVSCVKGLRDSSLISITGVQRIRLARNERKDIDRSPSKQGLDRPHNLAHVAAAIVFSLGLINKILNKSRVKTKSADCLGILRGIRQGGLPFSELSRDDMRSFLQKKLGLDFSQWHKFDSFCHQVDPDKNGFVDFPRLWKVFSNMGPKFNGISNPVASQRLHILLLSLASSALAQRKELMQNAIASAVSEMRIHERNSKVKASGKDSRDIIRLRDVESIADLLSHIIHFFFERYRGCNSYASMLPDWELCSYENHGIITPSKTKTRSSVIFELWSSEPARLKEACFAVAKSLNIYSYPDDSSIYNSFGSFLLTFCGFRLKVLKSSLQPECELSTFYSRDTQIHRKPRKSNHPLAHMHPSCLVNLNDLENLSRVSEESVRILLGAENFEKFINRTDEMKLEEFDIIISEVLGIPAPCGRGEDIGLALSSTQLDVEAFLYDQIPETLPKRTRSLSPQARPSSPLTDEGRSYSPTRLDTRSASRLLNSLDRAPMVVEVPLSKRPGSSGGTGRREWTKQMPKDGARDSDVGFILADHLEELNAHSLRMKSCFETGVRLLEAARAIKNPISRSLDPEQGIDEEQLRRDVGIILKKARDIQSKAEESITNKTTENILHRVAEDLERGTLRDPSGDIAREMQTIGALTATLVESKRDISKLCKIVIRMLR